MQAASFRSALRELDSDIPLVLQPGNHDVGQSPKAELVEEYKARPWHRHGCRRHRPPIHFDCSSGALRR
jgi:hypothetical protein